MRRLSPSLLTAAVYFEGKPVKLDALAIGDRWYLTESPRYRLKPFIWYLPKMYEKQLDEQDGWHYIIRLR